MTKVFSFDDEASRRLERTYSGPEVAAQRRAVLETIRLQPGERVLDVGCGPGFTVKEMAREVGSHGTVCGVDASDPAIELARVRCAQEANVQFQIGEATALPLPAAAFDAAVVTQVYEFVEDVDLALAELYRVLRLGGRALLLDTDWWTVVWHSSDEPRMRRVLKAWDEHLHHPVLPRTLGARLRKCGLTVRERRTFPLLTAEFKEGSYSFGLAKMIRAFVQGRQGITLEEADAWHADLQALADAGEYFFCLNRYMFLAEK